MTTFVKILVRDWRVSAAAPHLVAGDVPHPEHPGGPADQLELGGVVEQRAAVRAVVVRQVEAGRVRLVEVAAAVARGGEGAAEQPRVVHLLQTHQVGGVAQHLLGGNAELTVFICL